jgi:hypothetical protein
MNVVADSRGAGFAPIELVTGSTSTATELVAGPVVPTEVTQMVTLDGGGGPVELTTAATLGACTGPVAPGDIDFAFTAAPTADVAEVGDTVAYRLCGRNAGSVDVEVLTIADDRLGVFDLAGDGTGAVVGPGQTVCTDDLGLDVVYEVKPADAGETISNNTVVTARAFSGAPPQTFQLVAGGELDVAPVLTASTGTTTLQLRLAIAAAALVAGGVLLLAARRCPPVHRADRP